MHKLWINLLFSFAQNLPLRVISEDGKPYLERYFLAQFWGRRYYLHRFVASDPDRGYHDHPWRSAWSLLLSGWYYEVTRYGMRAIRWFNRLDGTDFHRVLIGDNPLAAEAPLEVWSLFSHTTPDVKVWGFWLPTFRGAFYTPYSYNGMAKNAQWEKTVPKGRAYKRDSRRVALPEQDLYCAGN